MRSVGWCIGSMNSMVAALLIKVGEKLGERGDDGVS